MRVLAAILMLAAAWILPVHAGTEMDLLAVYRLALERDAQIAAATSGRDAGLEDENMARAGILPSVHATGELARSRQKLDYTNPGGFLQPGTLHINKSSAGINLTQPLYRKDRWAAWQQGKINSNIAHLEYDLAGQDLMLRTSDAYFRVLQAQSTLEAARAQTKAMQELYSQAKTSFEIGTATINESLEAQARLDIARSDEIQADNDFSQAKAALSSLIVQEIDGLRPLPATLTPTAPQPADVEEWMKRAETSAVSVHLAEQNLALAKEEIERSKGLAYPALDAVASADRQQQSTTNFGTGSTTTTGTVSLKLDVPLYAGGASDAKLRQAQARMVQMQSRLDFARRQARLTARQAYLNMVASASQVEATQQAVASSEKARRAAALGHEVGLRTIVDVLDAEQRLFAAKRNLVRAQTAYVVSALQLKAATGALAETDLEEANRLLARIP